MSDKGAHSGNRITLRGIRENTDAVTQDCKIRMAPPGLKLGVGRGTRTRSAILYDRLCGFGMDPDRCAWCLALFLKVETRTFRADSGGVSGDGQPRALGFHRPTVYLDSLEIPHIVAAKP
jgi:hypothetical protein